MQLTPGRGGGIQYKDNPKKKLSSLSEVFVDLYNNEDKNKVKEALKNILNSENLLVDKRFKAINFLDSNSINVNIGLMNFIQYATKENYKHFLVHDYGAKGGNTGKFIYVSGSPDSMAEDLIRLGVNFQGISPNLYRPRMGAGTKGLSEDEE